MTRAYTVAIDWNNDGDYSDSYEDVSADVRQTPGLRLLRGRDQARSYSPPQAGRADFELDNESRRYSIEMTSGPLYGMLRPGRGVRVISQTDPSTYHALSGGGSTIAYGENGYTYGDSRQDYGGYYSIYDAPGIPYDGMTYPLFTGVLDDVQEIPDPRKVATSFKSFGSLSRLAGVKISTRLYWNITTDQALGYLLDAVGWPADRRRLSGGQTTLNVWWLDEEDAFQAAATLVASEGPPAVLYEDAHGNIVFEDRSFRSTAGRSQTAQAVFGIAGAEPAIRLIDVRRDAKHVINEVALTFREWQWTGELEVGFWGTSETFAANERRYFRWRSPDGWLIDLDMISPTVSTGSATATITRDSGASVDFYITAGGSGATLSDIGLGFTAWAMSREETVVSTVDASDSIAAYGKQRLNFSTRAEIDRNTLQDFANAIVSWYQTPKLQVSFVVPNGAPPREAQQLQREISDRIRVVDAPSGLDALVIIERIEHQILAGGASHATVFACEEAFDTGSYAIWGTSLWGSAQWGY